MEKADKEFALLIEKAREGDEGSLQIICTKLKELMHRYFIKRFYDQNIVDDLTQETYLRILNNILTFDEPISLKRFILKVAFHVMQDYFRQKYRRLEDPYIKGKINRDELSEEVDTYYNSDAHTDKILNKLDYEKAMARLPGKTREIFQLKGEGYKYEEIANILDVSVSSVKMQVKRGTEKLKVFIFSVTFFVFKTTV